MSPKLNPLSVPPEAEASENASSRPADLYDDAFAVSGEIDAAYATAPHTPPDSGDFHAAFPLENGNIGFVLGDVVGHGPEAAIHAQNLCKAVVGCLLEGLPPDDALGFVNAAAQMSTEFDGFATVVAGTIAAETGEIVYASGGHEPPLIAVPVPSGTPPNKRGVFITELDSTGPPLGVISGDEVSYTRRQASLPPNGTLLLYTDGVTEARRGKVFFGLDRLRALFSRLAHTQPLTLAHKIISYARAFTGQGRTLRDDAALLVLRRRPFKKLP